MARASARHPQLIVLDLIYVAVAQRRYETTGVALNLTAQAVSSHRALSPELARALRKEQR